MIENRYFETKTGILYKSHGSNRENRIDPLSHYISIWLWPLSRLYSGKLQVSERTKSLPQPRLTCRKIKKIILSGRHDAFMYVRGMRKGGCSALNILVFSSEELSQRFPTYRKLNLLFRVWKPQHIAISMILPGYNAPC